MAFLCLGMVLISLVSLYYYTRVCYGVLRQSGSVGLTVAPRGGRAWHFNFLLVSFVLGLVLAPIFVMIV